MKKNKKIVIAFVFSAFSFFSVFSQTSSAGLYSGNVRTSEEGFAAQEFRRGVQSYYRGTFNDAVMQFEKALGYMPNDSLILEWLGKSYYHSGMEGTAVKSWSKAVQNGYGVLLLKNKIEIVQDRRTGAFRSDFNARYTEAGAFSGSYGEGMVFSGPVSVLPENDGTVWVLAYGSNELVKLNINGTVVSRVTGPMNGFDRPMDLIRLEDGTMLVTESAGNRLCVLDKKGKFIKYIGKKGRAVGNLVGPQYAAQDSRQNIYVSDYGNRRIAVFDRDGKGLFCFGAARDDFAGLKGPTGIAVAGENVYVADNIFGGIYEFDLAGNFQRVLVPEKTFQHPESIRVWNDYLVVCDSNRVFSVDSGSGSVFENISAGNAPARLTCAVPDVNGNVVVSDVISNEVYVMSKMQELVGGLFVQIEKVNASKFPEVFVDVRVENRYRSAVVGLGENNFYITEQKRPVNKLKYLGSSSYSQFSDITLLIDRSRRSSEFGEQINAAVREIAASMKNRGTLKIVSASKIPALEYSGKPSGALKFDVAALKNPVSDEIPLDLALRLAANDLVNAEHKRAVVIISAGKVSLNAFEKYSLSETAAFLNNNHISVASVLLTQNACDEELDYIVSNTPGKEYYIFRPEGLSGIVGDLVDIPSGLYTFSYTSVLSTNFGEKYLPVEVEAYLLDRSGRDECGYFAPLQ